MHPIPRGSSTAIIFLLLVLLAPTAGAQDATVTYQGQLRQSGAPFTGTANLEFRLFDALSGGSQVGTTQTRPAWPVEDGLFQVELDFGIAAFTEQVRYLEVRVDGAPLSPRQAIRPSPMALFALGGNEGPAGPPGPIGPEGPPGASPFTLDPVTGTIEYLERSQVLRFAPNANSNAGPSIVLGHANNQSSAFGGVVSGGGRATAPNIASGSESTVGGGLDNIASEFFSTVSGGNGNRAVARGASIGGGRENTASGIESAVGGGDENTASGSNSAVPGGLLNCAGGAYSWAGGLLAKVRPGTNSGAVGIGCDGIASSGDSNGDNGTFVWADSQAISFISTGPDQFLVRATGGVGINTNSPQRQLHVQQRTTNNATSGITLQRSASTDQWGLYVSSSNDFIFVANNVGRGAIDPDTGQYSALSDQRAKREIEPLENVLDRFLQLQPSSYRMEHQGDEAPRSIGLVAQEVQPLFPEVVSRLDEDRLGLRYDEITVLNIQALIEMNQRHRSELATLRMENEHLRRDLAEVRTQAQRNAELEARLATLEEMLLTGRLLAGAE
jgi:hypothetical protein